MRVLPVIDLLRGEVVRGVGGEREKYQPVVSLLADDARPDSIGRAMVQSGFRDAYVADLDAIAGAEPDWRAYVTLMRKGLDPWVDAGCGSRERARALSAFQHEGRSLPSILIGLESLPSFAALTEILKEICAARLVFSLDLKHGRPLTRVPEWRDADPLAVLSKLYAIGVRRFVILDLAAVGRNSGPATTSLCAAARGAFPEIEIASGGGVRDLADLQALAQAGCDHVMVASALHDGRISPEALGEFQ